MKKKNVQKKLTKKEVKRKNQQYINNIGSAILNFHEKLLYERIKYEYRDYYKLKQELNNCKEIKNINKKDIILANGFQNAFSLVTVSGLFIACISAGFVKSNPLTISACAISGLSAVATGALKWVEKRIKKTDRAYDKEIQILKNILKEEYNIVEQEDEELENQ